MSGRRGYQGGRGRGYRGGGGGGGGWQHRGGGGGMGRGNVQRMDQDGEASSSSEGGTGNNVNNYLSDGSSDFERPRPPAHLKGKDIGMWYARQQGKRNRQAEIHEAMEVKLSDHFAQKINSIVATYEKVFGAEVKSEEGTSSRSGSGSCSFSVLLDEINAANERTGPSAPLSCEISRREVLDEQLYQEFMEMTNTSQYKKMLGFRERLPAWNCKDDIIEAVGRNQVVVISGETGCGKTTQTAQYIFDDMILKKSGSLCNILCTQPRRISAVSVAERVAEERCERVGSRSVGYVIRLESRRPKREQGSITFCTTGVVFQYLKDDPYLLKYSHIVLDEVHERDTNSDILMAVLKDIMKYRPDLKVILMSATINAEHFANYFGNCPMFHIPGLTFPVTEYYLEDIIEQLNFQFDRDAGMNGFYRPEFHRDYLEHLQAYAYQVRSKYKKSTVSQLLQPESENFDSLMPLAVQLIEEICKRDEDHGAILIFVTGWDEISRLNNFLSDSGRFPSERFLILPLHSLMPTVNQRQIFDGPPRGVTKIIISTNIAETSITVNDVKHVIDFGRIKMTNFDKLKNVESLDSEWVSNANAKQRKGRAGRTQDGYCYYLYSRARQRTFPDFQKPEVLRKRLEEIILQLKVLKLGNIRRLFKALLDSPTKDAVDLSFERLLLLQALDSEERLTPLGYHLSKLPMHPQIGKLVLLGAVFSVVDPVFSVAASLSYKDPFVLPLGKEGIVDKLRKDLADNSKSDHWVVAQAVAEYEDAATRNREREYCYRNYMSAPTCKLIVDFKKQFCDYLYDMKFLLTKNPKEPAANLNSSNIALVKAVICAGLYPNVAKVKPRSGFKKGPPFPTLCTKEDGNVYIHRKSVNSEETKFEFPFFCYHIKQKIRSKVMLFDTTMVSPYPVLFFGSSLRHIKTEGVDIVELDGTYRVKMSKDNFETISALRMTLERVLALKIAHPYPTDWDPDHIDGKLFCTIRDLITQQYEEFAASRS